MEVGKALAVNFFAKIGFIVETIDVAESRTADLRVSDDRSTYIVEVKDKFEGETQALALRNALKHGELYERNDPLRYDATISGILRDARDQLNQTSKRAGTFQLIWFHANGIDADLKYRQAFATFYGHVPLRAIEPRSPETKECFYFDYNAAYEMPDVEALILTDANQLQVCLNEFSTCLAEFRSTRLYQKFRELDGIFDTAALEAAGQIITCRSSMPRKNEHETAKALQEQTGVLYTPIRLNRYSIYASAHPDQP